MHDVLEGLLPYEVKEMLKVFVSKKIITHAELCTTMESFPYNGPDTRNKLTPVAHSTMLSSDHLLKQTGIHMYALTL